MAADTLPVMTGVLRQQRRSVVLWAVAVAAVAAVYIGFWPSLGGDQMTAMVDNLPEGLVTALGYDRIGTPGGWLTSTVYGLLGPALLSVFAVGTGARLLAGQEEDGTLELELSSPVSRRRLYLERLAALWLDVVVLVVAMTVVTYLLVLALDMEVGPARVLAGSTGLALLIVGTGTLTYAVGAATGRRALALAVGAGVAVASFVLDAIGPVADVDWMTAVSPFSWYLGDDPLIDGFDWGGLALLALVPAVAGVAGLARFVRRDVMV